MLEQKDLSLILETAIVAARHAGHIALEEADMVDISIKNGVELVTQADSKCQQAIINQVKQVFPDHGFIGEEGSGGKMFKQSPRAADGLWWVIDPIDGTNNYAFKIPLFAVSIGVIYKGEPVVGVIYDPSTDLIFTGVKGEGAQLNGRAIKVSDKQIDKFSNIGLDSHYDNGVPKWVQNLMQQTRFRNLGTAALQFAYVANGGMTGTVFYNTKLWDIAGGVAIIEAAGGIVTAMDGSKIFPMDMEKYQGERTPIVAANRKIHSGLIELIKNNK